MVNLSLVVYYLLLFNYYKKMKIDYILIPQGQEFKTVKKGFNLAQINHPPLISIPVGIRGVQLFLDTWLNQVNFQHQRVLLLGLGGSLSPKLKVGDLTFYQNCCYLDNDINKNEPILTKSCDLELNNYLQICLQNQFKINSVSVQGLTSNKLINLASQKQQLFEQNQAEVIDMEAWTILTNLEKFKIKLSVLRIISDDNNHNIPDLNNAFSPEGKLKPLSLALGLIGDPLAGLTLIKGSLTALKKLEKVAFNLAQILA